MTIRNKTANIYTEWLPLIDTLPDETAGKIFKNILRYQNGDEVNDNLSVWIFIKSKIDEYNQKLIDISEKRKISGSYGGLAKASKCQQMLASVSKCSNKRKEKKIKENNIKRKSIVSDDWFPNEETQSKISAMGLDVNKVVDYFKRQCQAKGIEYINFDKAILNWKYDDCRLKREKVFNGRS